MGAKSVTIVYRRSHEKMPAREIELNEALKDGTKIIYNTKVVEAVVENEKIKSIKCNKTEQINDVLQDIKNSEFDILADSIVFAIGLKPNKELLVKQGIKFEGNLIKVNEENKTNIVGVFARWRCNAKQSNCLHGNKRRKKECS